MLPDRRLRTWLLCSHPILILSRPTLRPTAIQPAHFPWFDYSRYSFSLGLKAGAGAYLSGHTASEHDPVTKRMVVRGDMSTQVRTAWKKIGAILEAAGYGYGDVVRVVEYLRPEEIGRAHV